MNCGTNAVKQLDKARKTVYYNIPNIGIPTSGVFTGRRDQGDKSPP